MNIDCRVCVNNKRAKFCKAGKDKSFVQMIKDVCENFVPVKNLKSDQKEAT